MKAEIERIAKVVADDGAPVRVQLDMAKARVQDMETLGTACGLTTRKDVIENALACLEWMADRIAQGDQIVALNPKGVATQRELVMPCLEFIRRRGKK